MAALQSPQLGRDRASASGELPKLLELTRHVMYRQIEFPTPAGWSLLNPSLTTDGDRLHGIVRSANFRVGRNGQYPTSDPDGVVRTRNYLATLDAEVQLQAVDLLAEEVPAGRYAFPVEGFEDCRPIQVGDRWLVAATMRDRNPAGICQMALLRLDGLTLRDLVLLSDAATGRHEKNWMPFTIDSRLHFLYTASPTVVLRYDEEAERIERLAQGPGPESLRNARGGSQGVRVDGGWLFAIHENLGTHTERRYAHRLILMNDDFIVTHASPRFSFHGAPIEFCAGMALLGDRLYLSHGFMDKRALVVDLPVENALTLLEPAPDAAKPEQVLRADRGDAIPGPALEDNAAADADDDIAADAADSEAEEPSGRPFVVQPMPPEAGLVSPPWRAARRPAPGAPLRLVSVTMTGNSRDVIADALKSVVDWVDQCLIIDTGITDDTLEVARSIVGDKLAVREFPWQEDFSAARNFSLAAADETGAHWAVVIDTDERLRLDGAAIRALLETTEADVVDMPYEFGTYSKQRFFRLPPPGEFKGPTHEGFHQAPGVTQIRFESGSFTELLKSDEQYRRKAERDVRILRAYTAKHPTQQRWWYYLGDALQGLERYEEAIAAYARCAALPGWDEEGAWACFRSGQCWNALGKYRQTIDICARGMTIHSGLPELPWLASWAAYQLGNYQQAISWAHIAAALGGYDGIAISVERQGFSEPPAIWEAPYDVMRFAYRALGKDEAADLAEEAYQHALAERTGG